MFILPADGCELLPAAYDSPDRLPEYRDWHGPIPVILRDPAAAECVEAEIELRKTVPIAVKDARRKLSAIEAAKARRRH